MNLSIVEGYCSKALSVSKGEAKHDLAERRVVMTRRCVTDEQNGRLWRKLNEVARRVDEGAIPFDQVMTELQLIIECKFSISVQGTVYLVTVNYDQSLTDMIKAGHYDWTDQDITAGHFWSRKKRTAELAIQLIHFNKHMGSENVLSELEKQGLRAVTLPELLVFGAAYPELQRQFPIVALGSVWQDFSGGNVPYLWGYSNARGLDLNWFEGGWNSRSRFAAVGK